MKLHHLGGSLGQRERIYCLTWAMVLLSGVLRHYDLGPDLAALQLVVGAGIGIIGSYTYKPSAARTEPGEAPPPAGG